MPIASVFTSVDPTSLESAAGLRGLLSADVGIRCWMMVLLTANLYAGWPPAGADSEIRARSMEF